MKYWLFQNNQVNGPHDPEELSQLPSYSAESLVCPEGSKGTSMGDWRRAGMVPELAASLVKEPLAARGKQAPSSGGYAALPPEPTFKDLAALGGLQEKFSSLETIVTQMQQELHQKDADLSELHKELEDKQRLVGELTAKISGIEEKVSGVSALRDNLDQAVAAEKNVESSVETQRRSLEEVNSTLEKLRAEVKEIDQIKADMREEIREIASIKEEVKEIGQLRAEVKEIEQLKVDVKEIERHKVDIKDIERLKAEVKELESRKSPPPEIPPPPSKLATPVPPAPAISAQATLPQPFSISPPPSVPIKETLVAPGFSPVHAAPAAPSPVLEKKEPPLKSVPVAPKPAPEAAMPEKPKSNKSRFALAALALTLLAFGGAYFTGVLSPVAKMEQEPAPEETLPPPQPAETPMPAAAQASPASLEAQQEELKQAALGLVKGWPSASGNQTLSQELEGAMPSAGLSPWMAEKVKDDVYQVNFYPKAGADGRQIVYEFEARLNDKRVSARNDFAQALLSGKMLAAAPPKPRKGLKKSKASRRQMVKIKPKALPELQELSPQPGAAAESAAPSASQPPAAAEPAPEEEAPQDAPAPKKKPRGQNNRAADADLLDDLLKP